uniref:FOXP coiled-coil domain-containing protein n=1 Tax=Petromyzon marinus TaxID=7757 RepID=S4RJQ1_PETMA
LQVPVSMAMMTPQVITSQQMQQLLQQQVLSPQQIQVLLQQQQQSVMLQQQMHQLETWVKNQSQHHQYIPIFIFSQRPPGGSAREPLHEGHQHDSSQTFYQQTLFNIPIMVISPFKDVINMQRQGLMQQALQRPGLPQDVGYLDGHTFPPTIRLTSLLPSDLQHLWKETSSLGSHSEEGPSLTKNGGGLDLSLSNPVAPPGALPLPRTSPTLTYPPLTNGQHTSTGSHIQRRERSDCSSSHEDFGRDHALYGHGVCKWPGCETVCEEFSQFLKHLNNEHALDDRSTAQCRVQMQVVHQLEIQLDKERERLQAMMAHLHMCPAEPKHPLQPVS